MSAGRQWEIGQKQRNSALLAGRLNLADHKGVLHEYWHAGPLFQNDTPGKPRQIEENRGLLRRNGGAIVTTLKKAFEHIRQFALAYPETREDHPWGESAIKVKGKTFVFMGLTEGRFGLSVKLPRSRDFALDYPFTEPTHYGLGKSGWISASFTGKDSPPLDVLRFWVDESFRAIAPKKLVATAPELSMRSPAAKASAKKKKPAARKPARK